MFRWFTIDSNILTTLAAALIIPFAIEGISKKRLTYPKWLQRIHYSGTVCLALTFIFSAAFISWYDPVIAFGGANFFLHIICPLMIVVSFFMVESNHRLDRKDNLISVIPTAAYAALYCFQVVITKRWDDFYHLNTYIPFALSALLMIVLVYVIGWLIRILQNRLHAFRERKLKLIWEEALDPISVRIEIYSLGVHAGMYEEKDDISVPFDILEDVADQFDIKLEVLSKAYIKGAIDGIKRKESSGAR